MKKPLLIIRKPHPLKLRIRRSGFFAADFAHAAGVTPADLSRYFAGYASPRAVKAIEKAVEKHFGSTRRLSA